MRDGEQSSNVKNALENAKNMPFRTKKLSGSTIGASGLRGLSRQSTVNVTSHHMQHSKLAKLPQSHQKLPSNGIASSD